ncbi:unnamed protein product [Alopecurus aequalis]
MSTSDKEMSHCDCHYVAHVRGEGQGRRKIKNKDGFAEMEEAADLSDFEFFLPIYQNSGEKLRLPDKFAEVLDGREPRQVKLREAGGGRRLWVVEVVFDGNGHMHLGHGWEQFARAHDLQLGYFLVFSYDGDAVLSIKVFDGSMCRRYYDDDDAANTTPVPRSSPPVTIKEEEDSRISPDSESGSDSGSKNRVDSGSSKNRVDSGSKNSVDGGSSKNSSSAEMDIDDAPTSQFTVMLRQCHLGERNQQYLNVPSYFQIAHGYHKRSKVALRMRGGKSWTVNLKLTPRARGNPRTSLRYGWHQFCVDNRLGVGDICFFQALRGSDADRREDHELKVEVRRRDGTFAD